MHDFALLYLTSATSPASYLNAERYFWHLLCCVYMIYDIT